MNSRFHRIPPVQPTATLSRAEPLAALTGSGHRWAGLMKLEISITPDDVERIATRTAQLLAETMTTGIERWLDVPGATDHLALTPDAIRGLVKRGQIPFHRTANGRSRFSTRELDDWVRTGSCAPTREDLP